MPDTARARSLVGVEVVSIHLMLAGMRHINTSSLLFGQRLRRDGWPKNHPTDSGRRLRKSGSGQGTDRSQGGLEPPKQGWQYSIAYGCVHVSPRDRGGAPEGTPELYFTDPDGILMQLQDVTYCGGAGYLGDMC